jgi:2-dehydropantoate 2-reductase
MDNARLLVIGAGVNGSAVAAGLYNGGIDVTVLARGKRFQELRDEGIVIENPFNNKRSVTRVPVIDLLDPRVSYDFVLVIVRKNQALDLLPLLTQNRSPNIVFMGNNLSGPDEFIKALGKERVMMGAVYAAGRREGSLIRAMVTTSVAAPFGEVDGTITPRLGRLIGILRRAGFKAQFSRQIVDFQTTHAVGVALIGKLVLKYGCEVRALARSTDDLKLFVEARHEAHRVLRTLGRRIIPWSEVAIGIVPSFLQVASLRALLNSKLGEVGLAYHVSQAPDEVRQLALELQALVNRAGIPVPAIRKVLEWDKKA